MREASVRHEGETRHVRQPRDGAVMRARAGSNPGSNMETWELVGLVLGGNINRSRAQEDQWPLQPGRSGLSPISAADINPSSLTHLY